MYLCSLLENSFWEVEPTEERHNAHVGRDRYGFETPGVDRPDHMPLKILLKIISTTLLVAGKTVLARPDFASCLLPCEKSGYVASFPNVSKR